MVLEKNPPQEFVREPLDWLQLAPARALYWCACLCCLHFFYSPYGDFVTVCTVHMHMYPRTSADDTNIKQNSFLHCSILDLIGNLTLRSAKMERQWKWRHSSRWILLATASQKNTGYFLTKLHLLVITP